MEFYSRISICVIFLISKSYYQFFSHQKNNRINYKKLVNYIYIYIFWKRLCFFFLFDIESNLLNRLMIRRFWIFLFLNDSKTESESENIINRKEIIICWTPRHIRVRGKERADSAAKSALDLTPDKSRIPYIDLKPTINKFLHTKWQQQWSNNTHNKLFQIQPTLGEWRPASRKSRRELVVISRLWIGHTRLTHSFILKQEPQPQCLTCQTTCTVKHILIECRVFAVIRKRFFKVNSLTDLFENVRIDDVLSFLRETELYPKIWRIKTD